jgi:hypothetical protein
MIGLASEIAVNDTEINAIDMICTLVQLIIQKSDQTSIDLTGNKLGGLIGTSSTMVSSLYLISTYYRKQAKL